MRWFWIDRFEKFVSGKEAVAVKNVTISEESLDDYLPGFPHYSHSLIIEGMAQTGGLLLAQIDDFRPKVVLAKVGKAEFQRLAKPGDQLRLTATLLSRQAEGAIVSGVVTVNGEPMAELQLTFAILDDSFGEESFFVPGDLCRILRSWRVFDVGVNEDGTPIEIPDYLLEAELAQIEAPEVLLPTNRGRS